MASKEELEQADQLVDRCQDVIRYSEKVLADPSAYADFADYWADVEAERRRATFVVVDGDAQQPDVQSA
jgi:hypothetical protein